MPMKLKLLAQSKLNKSQYYPAGWLAELNSTFSTNRLYRAIAAMQHEIYCSWPGTNKQ